MKDQILKLRSEGKSYREIQKTLGCTRSLISYYVNPNGKQKQLNRQNKNRHRRRFAFKQEAGGKCEICGYSRCLDALQFHHKDPTKKDFMISEALWGKQKLTDDEIRMEIKKCRLVCANCHAELHSQVPCLT